MVIGAPEDLGLLPDFGTARTVGDLMAVTRQAAPVVTTGVAVRMLTSGTTGPPKRVDLTYDMLAVSVMGADFANTAAPKAVSAGVAIVNAPLVHIGGVYRVLQCVAEARPFVLLPRFDWRLGRGGAPLPSQGGVAGAGRTAGGTALRAGRR